MKFVKNKSKICACILLLLTLAVFCLTACETECTVTYVLNNGDRNITETVSVFSKAPLLDKPKKDGFVFDGWYMDEECTQRYSHSALVTESITLYAGWSVDAESVVNAVSRELMGANVKVKSHFYKLGKIGLVHDSTSQGSGVIIKKYNRFYYMLTNCHVTAAAEDIKKTTYFVYDMFGNEYEAELVCTDPSYDLSLLRFEAVSGANLTVAEFGSGIPDENEFVVALGQPGGQINSLTVGHVIDYETVEVKADSKHESNVTFPVLWCTAPTKNGSSGGGLFNSDLELVGINYATSYKDNEFKYTFSIPIDKVKEFLSNNKFEV